MDEDKSILHRVMAAGPPGGLRPAAPRVQWPGQRFQNLGCRASGGIIRAFSPKGRKSDVLCADGRIQQGGRLADARTRGRAAGRGELGQHGGGHVGPSHGPEGREGMGAGEGPA